jgi:hypothetical protein
LQELLAALRAKTVQQIESAPAYDQEPAQSAAAALDPEPCQPTPNPSQPASANGHL